MAKKNKDQKRVQEKREALGKLYGQKEKKGEDLQRTTIAVIRLAGLTGSIVALGPVKDTNLIVNLVVPLNGVLTAIPFDVPAALVARELLDALIRNAIGGYVPEVPAAAPPNPAAVNPGEGKGEG